MIVYAIADGSIRLRQTSGEQFEFAVVTEAEKPSLRLSRPPFWPGGLVPVDAEVRIYLARASAQRIARDHGIL